MASGVIAAGKYDGGRTSTKSAPASNASLDNKIASRVDCAPTVPAMMAPVLPTRLQASFAVEIIYATEIRSARNIPKGCVVSETRLLPFFPVECDCFTGGALEDYPVDPTFGDKFHVSDMRGYIEFLRRGGKEVCQSRSVYPRREDLGGRRGHSRGHGVLVTPIRSR